MHVSKAFLTAFILLHSSWRHCSTQIHNIICQTSTQFDLIHAQSILPCFHCNPPQFISIILCTSDCSSSTAGQKTPQSLRSLSHRMQHHILFCSTMCHRSSSQRHYTNASTTVTCVPFTLQSYQQYQWSTSSQNKKLSYCNRSHVSCTGKTGRQNCHVSIGLC